MPVTLDDKYLPYPVISVQERNILVETPLTERGGSAIEQVGGDNLLISIRGLIISPTNDYPEEEVKLLRDLKRSGKAMRIASPITDIFLQTQDRRGFDKVVVRSLVFPEVRGIVNVRPYEMELISDNVFDLIET